MVPVGEEYILETTPDSFVFDPKLVINKPGTEMLPSWIFIKMSSPITSKTFVLEEVPWIVADDVSDKYSESPSNFKLRLVGPNFVESSG